MGWRSPKTVPVTRDRVRLPAGKNGKEEEYAAALSESEMEMSQFTELTTYFAYALLILVGHIRDFFGKWTSTTTTTTKSTKKTKAPLFKNWENFYARRLYRRIGDVFNRPICSSPSARIDVMGREFVDGKFRLTKEVIGGCLNLGSYNYLGFADDWLATCGPPVLSSLEEWPVTCSSPQSELGTTMKHVELERQIAGFVGKEDAVVFNMGYGTNMTTVPAIVGKGDLVLSDALNHASLVNGCRASGAFIRSFAHNDFRALETALREAVAFGVPRTRRPFKKILVVVEGIYSMEGEICDLKNIARVCKMYKAYLYLDEAHSIGALGPTGRGACEQCGVDPKDVDILMGTFTKSFGGMGGYVASSKKLCDHLRASCPGLTCHDSMSCVMCSQISTATHVIANSAIGAQKIHDLKRNANYFRSELIKLGLHVYGDYDSPVIPVLLYNPTKIAAFSRECLDEKLAVVVVGFPATTLVKSRARFCVSAGHSLDDLKDALQKINHIADKIKIKYAASAFG